jgi:hypothetical protein
MACEAVRVAQVLDSQSLHTRAHYRRAFRPCSEPALTVTAALSSILCIHPQHDLCTSHIMPFEPLHVEFTERCADCMAIYRSKTTRNDRFKPKQATKGTTSWQLKQYAEATLGSGSLKKAVKTPEGESEDEWLAVNGALVMRRILLEQAILLGRDGKVLTSCHSC